MSDGAAAPAATAVSPGALLRAARERSGVHIAALAAGLKVPVRKLEALEADRHAELTDATFVRALTLSVCRQLRIDAEPILTLLPDPADPLLRTHTRLARVHMPPRDDFVSVASPLRWVRRPLVWLVVALLAAALALVLWPQAPGVTTSPASSAAPPLPAEAPPPGGQPAMGAPAPAVMTEPTSSTTPSSTVAPTSVTPPASAAGTLPGVPSTGATMSPNSR